MDEAMRTLLLVVLLSLTIPALAQYQTKRSDMVRKQIQARGVRHTPTLNAMRKVERHRFVPADLRDRAYQDTPLPIGFGQTISQPYIVGYMTMIVRPEPGFRVLEIGTGSGYQAAVLAEIVSHVYTIEIVPALGKRSSDLFDELGYTNIHSKVADGYYGWEEHAPFDAIIVTAAAEFIPPPLIEQLKEGGRMIIPVGSPFMVQSLMLVEKKRGKVTTRNMFPVRFVPFTRK